MYNYSDALPLHRPLYQKGDGNWHHFALSFIAFCLAATVIVVWIFNEKSDIYCSDLIGMDYEDESFKLIKLIFSPWDGDDSFRFINRSTWGARDPKSKTTFPKPPPDHVIIIQTSNQPCSSLRNCSRKLRITQNIDMDTLGFDDIAYNFFIGGDGETYEGRGWDVEGAITHDFNNRSLGIAFIGCFQNFPPPTNQLEQARVLISESVKRGKLSQNYKLVGYRQASGNISPDDALYKIIKTWPHWEHCYMSSC